MVTARSTDCPMEAPIRGCSSAAAVTGLAREMLGPAQGGRSVLIRLGGEGEWLPVLARTVTTPALRATTAVATPILTRAERDADLRRSSETRERRLSSPHPPSS